MAMPELKDGIGNILHKGDLVYVDTTNKITIGEIVNIKQGGIVPGPATITIIAEIEMTAVPGSHLAGVLALRHPIKSNVPTLEVPPSLKNPS